MDIEQRAVGGGEEAPYRDEGRRVAVAETTNPPSTTAPKIRTSGNDQSSGGRQAATR
jgi:hypothetical protein